MSAMVLRRCPIHGIVAAHPADNEMFGPHQRCHYFYGTRRCDMLLSREWAPPDQADLQPAPRPRSGRPTWLRQDGPDAWSITDRD